MKVFSRYLLVAALVALSSAVAFAQADFYVTVSDDPDPVAAGGTITYTVEVGNIGDAPSTANINTDVYLPPGVPAGLEAYLSGDADAVAAFDAMWDSILIDENIFDDENSGFYAGEDFYCEGFMLQPQGLTLGPGVSGSFSYEVMAPEAASRGYFAISAPGIDREITNYGRGGCSTTADDCTGTPCIGPRLTMIEPVTAPIELADDGSGNSEGCTPLVGFTPGNIALIDRGTCAFELKAVMATNAGAAGVIIGDSDNFGDNTVDPDDILNMGCTDFCSQEIVTIPSVLISWADVDALKSDLTGATATMGAIDTEGVIYTDTQIWESGNASDTNEENDTWTEETTIGSGPVVDPPEASFTYAPMEPTTDDEIQFTDTSTGEGISAWAWDFGGMATSDMQNPTYTFEAAGTYTVSLTVTNDGGDDMFSTDITVTEGGGVVTLDEFYFIPAAAKVEGAEGSFFVTDMVINNAGMDMATYQFLWLPRNTDNASPTPSDMYTLEAGMNVVYSDVLGSAFGVEDGAAGALAVISDSDMLKMTSRTFNQTEDGTFGQSIMGYHSSQLIQPNMKMRMIFFVENDEYRSNLGLLNGTGDPIRIYWERFTADGTSVEEGTTDLAAWGNTQINQVFDAEAPVNGGYIDVWCTSGAFMAYGSLLDNMTSDPTTVVPQ